MKRVLRLVLMKWRNLKESVKLDDEEEDPVEVTKDEEVEAEEEGLLDVLAKMLGGWW